VPTPGQYAKAAAAAAKKGDDEAANYFRTKSREGYRAEVGPATEGMSGGEKFRAGIGQGLTQAHQSVGNILGLVDKDTIRRREETDKDLLSTGAGLAGSVVGGAAYTAPIGMGAGALAGRGLQAIGRGGKLARALAMAGAQGASEGAVLASPDDRLRGALVGGGLGGGLTLAGRGLGKAMDFLGKNRMSDEAIELTKRLRSVPGQEKSFIPASQALEPGMGKQLYEGGVANLPWAGSTLRGQFAEALGDTRTLAITKALPAGVDVGPIHAAGDDMSQALRLAKASWDDAFKPVNTAKMEINGAFLPLNVRKLLIDEGITIPRGRVTGKRLNILRDQLQALANEQKGLLGRTRKMKIVKQKDRLTELMGKFLTKDVGAKWADDLGQYKNFEDIMAAAKKAPGNSEFTMKQLAAETSKRAGRKGLMGEGGELQEIGALGQKALVDFPSRQGIFQTLAATGAAGAAAGYLTDKGTLPGAAAAMTIAILTGRGLALPAVQKMVMEGMSSPRAARALLNKYPEIVQGLGRYARQAAVATTGGE
jgi:hypothetical protein